MQYLKRGLQLWLQPETQTGMLVLSPLHTSQLQSRLELPTVTTKKPASVILEHALTFMRRDTSSLLHGKIRTPTQKPYQALPWLALMLQEA
jgi:hypothetical protein